MEIWKDIPNYEGLYQASNLGRIKSLSKKDFSGHSRVEKIMNGRKSALGYIVVTLRKCNKQKLILAHRLIAKTFIENIENKPWINHIDNDTTNNRVENLEWCTPKENSYHRDIQGRNRDISGIKNPMFGLLKDKSPNYRGKSYKARIILDSSTGIYYDSIADAADAKNIKYNTLKARLHERTSYLGLMNV